VMDFEIGDWELTQKERKMLKFTCFNLRRQILTMSLNGVYKSQVKGLGWPCDSVGEIGTAINEYQGKMSCH
jgi:hypothetical protein